MLTLEGKKEIVKDIKLILKKELVDNKKSLVLFNFSSIDSEDLLSFKLNLRNLYKGEGFFWKVYKNTLLSKALKDLNDGFSKIKGNNALIICNDPHGVSLIAKKIGFNSLERFSGGFINGRYFGEKDMKEYSSIPSKEFSIRKIYKIVYFKIDSKTKESTEKADNMNTLITEEDKKKVDEISGKISNFSPLQLDYFIKKFSEDNDISSNYSEETSHSNNTENEKKEYGFIITPKEGCSAGNKLSLFKLLQTTVHEGLSILEVVKLYNKSPEISIKHPFSTEEYKNFKDELNKMSNFFSYKEDN